MATEPVSIRFDKNLLKRLDGVAKKQGYGRAEAIREAVRRFIE